MRRPVIAEKLHAMVRFGTRNSRMKDYFDLHALAREGVVDETILSDAITATFERRASEVPEVVPAGLTDTFASEPSAPAPWKAFLARNRLEAPAPPSAPRSRGARTWR